MLAALQGASPADVIELLGSAFHVVHALPLAHSLSDLLPPEFLAAAGQLPAFGIGCDTLASSVG